MKYKSTILLLMMGIILIVMIQLVNAYSPHYLPGGKNYLNEINFEVDNDEYYTIAPFLVKPYTEYTLTIPRLYADEPDIYIGIYLYQNDTYLDYIQIDFQDTTYYDDGSSYWYYYTFETTSETNYLSLLFFNPMDYFVYNGLDNFQLEEGSGFTGYEPYIEGTLIDTSAPYFQNAGTVISYVDSPITVVEIQSALIAYDAIDGDVTGNITVISDDYTSNIDVLGTYLVVFEVSDASGNTSQTTVEVELIDVLKPMFSELSTIQAVFPNTYSAIDIQNMLSASDNHDGDISNLIVLVSDDYTANSSTVGMYEMEFSVTDSSGNIQNYIQTIEVVDNEGPIISGITSIIIGYDEVITPEAVMSNLSVADNYDAESSLSFVIETNDYSGNPHSLGSYSMVFSVEDSSGNTTYQTVTIDVVDELGPMVYFDSSIIQTYNDTVMALPEFTQLLISANEIDPYTDYYVTIKYDSYTRNAKTPGVYHLSLNYRTEDGSSIDKSFEVRVVDRPADYIQVGESENIEYQSFFSQYKEYFIGGIATFMLLVSNAVWIVVFKKR